MRNRGLVRFRFFGKRNKCEFIVAPGRRARGRRCGGGVEDITGRIYGGASAQCFEGRFNIPRKILPFPLRCYIYTMPARSDLAR